MFSPPIVLASEINQQPLQMGGTLDGYVDDNLTTGMSTNSKFLQETIFFFFYKEIFLSFYVSCSLNCCHSGMKYFHFQETVFDSNLIF